MITSAHREPRTTDIAVGDVERHLSLLADGATFEIRALVRERGRDAVLSGYFTEPSIAAAEVAKQLGNANSAFTTNAAYVTLNPVRPELRARCSDRLAIVGRGGTTSDSHITSRTRLLVDVDAAPVAGISTTNAEHEAALELAWEIASDLSETGWPEPIVGDSGNGAHLEYAIDLPVDDGGLVERVLKGLNTRYGRDTNGIALKIDTGNHNPARITKLKGTWARKGDDVPERPHRRASIVMAPDRLVAVTREQLESLAGQAPAQEPASTGSTRFDVDAWLARYSITVRSSSPWKGGTLRVLETCPYNPDHTHGEAHVLTLPSGAIQAGCKHNTCGLTWEWLREQHEPKATRSDGQYERLIDSVKRQNTSQTPQPATVVTLSGVTIEHVEWLWPGRIPLGMLTALDGDPGLGKSTTTLDVTARVTRGKAMPLEAIRRPPRDVVLIGAEDHLGATVAPRLRAAGADLDRVHAITAVPRPKDPDALPHLGDVAEVERVVVAKGAELVVVDPFMAFLPPGVDAYRDSDIRGVLAPWAAMAARTGCAVVLVRHLRKGAGSAIYRGGGSIGVIGAARSGLLVAKDPDEPGSCVLAHTKGNLCPPPAALRYRVVDCDGVGKIEWLGICDFTADELAVVPGSNRDDDDADPVNAAAEALAELLAGGPRPTADVMRDVKAMTGASPRTIERARSRLGVLAHRSYGLDGRVIGWNLSLPGGVDSSPAGGVVDGMDPSPHRHSTSGGGVVDGCADNVSESQDSSPHRHSATIHTATSTGGVDIGVDNSPDRHHKNSGGPGGAGGVDGSAGVDPGGVRQTSMFSADVFAGARRAVGLHGSEDDE